MIPICCHVTINSYRHNTNKIKFKCLIYIVHNAMLNYNKYTTTFYFLIYTNKQIKDRRTFIKPEELDDEMAY